ncbi:response regulator transcription factor [Xanthomonas campestris pv. badrii]|uniref:Response regulator transcription factor n=1 Tax=Xanthomonas campestris pv. badrii TaxID=149696 RepID=A0A7Z2V7X5_XANCA|nr:response regulator transcription factor [Xanthomonas campestris]MCC4603055.1 response regulator transcription factor [Xanthomonas campestris pv. parthenii]QJD66647.1 response regulator transcription factor [Xanthomonas campestris pv. badrii]
MRLLLVEDEQDIVETLTHFLVKQGFVVDLAPTLAIARTVLLDNAFDLVLLDRRLPDGDGLSLIMHARAHSRPQRFIMLTALADLDSKVSGLELGAHDYIAKPFEPRELLARIRNALRHDVITGREVKRLGPLGYDADGRAFWINDEPLTLRRTEALVLAALMARPGVIVPRQSLEARVYGYDRLVSSNSLESQISRLRRIIGEKTQRVRIHSVRGVGYSLVEE